MEFISLKNEGFGLEINDYCLRIALLKEKKGGFFCSSSGVFDVDAGLLVNGEIKKPDLLAETIKTALKDIKGEKIVTKYVAASLPEDKAFLQVVQMPKITEEDLKSAVIFEAENYIPMPLDKVYLDYQVIPFRGEDLDHLDVLIVAYPRDIIDSYVAVIEAAGLKPVALELESQALSRALMEDGHTDAPVMVIEVGDVRTNLIIYAGSSLRFSFTIPISNNYFLETIAKELAIDLIAAEELKEKFGVEKFNDNDFHLNETVKPQPAKKEKDAKEKEQRMIFEALIPCLVDFMQQVGKYMDYYHSHASHEHLANDKKKISKIILCGSGASLKGLDHLISLKFSLPVEMGKPGIGPFQGKKPSPFKANIFGLETVFGLAMRQFEK